MSRFERPDLADDSAFDPGLVDLHGRPHTRFRFAFAPSRRRGGAVAWYAELADSRRSCRCRVDRDNPGAFRRELWRVILKATNRAAMAVPVPAPFVPTVEGLTFGGSNGGEQRVERPRQGIPANCRLDEQPCVAQLAARAAAQEPPHLRFGLPAAPGGLALQRAERPEVALRVEECFDPCGAHGADQLVLQIVDADVEPEVLHVGARAG